MKWRSTKVYNSGKLLQWTLACISLYLEGQPDKFATKCTVKSSEATDRGWKVKAMNDDRITQVHKNVKHMPERMNARIEMRVEKQGLCFFADRHYMHQLNWRKNPTRCHLLLYYAYVRLNMFREPLCPSHIRPTHMQDH